ncbi:hypothetical protein CI109_102949 [Kwoniella shandongensis]|uniref:Uncharacterized protein n=1 Tax=Kwoniella shandongensis TaxID=1734106 RepID=A0A5M6C832_9TREE|nr:uncharacterized protein CI109_000137 [Kwoniella shandongensis]KAA5531297.1 hypothetical protein CI109_000137 [Kwoniella shandongensis]
MPGSRSRNSPQNETTARPDIFAPLGSAYFTPTVPSRTIDLFVAHSGRLFTPPTQLSSNDEESVNKLDDGLCDDEKTKGTQEMLEKLPRLMFAKRDDPLIPIMRTRPWVLYDYRWVQACVKAGRMLPMGDYVIDEEERQFLVKEEEEQRFDMEARRESHRLTDEVGSSNSTHNLQATSLSTTDDKEDEHLLQSSSRKNEEWYHNPRLTLDTTRPVVLLPHPDDDHKPITSTDRGLSEIDSSPSTMKKRKRSQTVGDDLHLPTMIKTNASPSKHSPSISGGDAHDNREFIDHSVRLTVDPTYIDALPANLVDHIKRIIEEENEELRKRLGERDLRKKMSGAQM